MADTPARSQTNTTCRPSGAHIGADGWRMSTSCSIVRPPRDGCADGCIAKAASMTATNATAMADFIAGQYRSKFSNKRSQPAQKAREPSIPRLCRLKDSCWLRDRPDDAAETEIIVEGCMSRMLRFLAAAIVLAIAAPAFAQVQTGSILVRAMDEQGALMPGVTITISSPVLVAGTMSAVTDAGGVYRFPSLVPGTYGIKIELTGFQTVNRENIVVLVGQTTPVEFLMKIASVAEN